jgi:hypothetical protein
MDPFQEAVGADLGEERCDQTGDSENFVMCSASMDAHVTVFIDQVCKVGRQRSVVSRRAIPHSLRCHSPGTGHRLNHPWIFTGVGGQSVFPPTKNRNEASDLWVGTSVRSELETSVALNIVDVAPCTS